jgi:hypothetical protein
MMMRRNFCLLLLLAFATRADAAGSDPASLGTFEDWEAFSYEQANAQVCYALSRPTTSEASRKSIRDPAYFMVTRAPARKVVGEVSTIIGYPFQEGSMVKLQAGEHSYEMPTDGDTAWIPSPELEQRIIVDLRKASLLKVTGVSARGTETIDTYSLKGFSAAMDKIVAACK